MTSVVKAFNISPYYLTKGDLGIEIEVEGDNLPRPDNYWRCEHDGSLRGECMEYVLLKPMSSKGTTKALHYLSDCYDYNNTTINESVRAGVHVHVNVQTLSVVQLYSFITAYIILEDALTKYCGKYREGNLFCLRIKDADYLLYQLEVVAKTKDYRLLNTDMLRYAAMNVKALSTYGSLEFRAMRGTRDLKAIDRWAKVLLNLRNEAKSFINPEQLIDWINDNGSESFCKRFLGDFYEELYNRIGGDIDITDGLVRAYNLAVNTDWESFKTTNIGGLEFTLGTEFPDEPEEDF